MQKDWVKQLLFSALAVKPVTWVRYMIVGLAIKGSDDM